MSDYKFIIIFGLLLISGFSSIAQRIEDNYQYVKSLDPKMTRKIRANEIMIDDKEKYVFVNYENRPTFIVVYSMKDFEPIISFRLSNWVEFSGAYIDYELNQLYIKQSRYSSDYYRLDINTGQKDIVNCELTPGGCPIVEPTKSVKSTFSISEYYYITINKRNPRDVRVYQLKK